MPRPNAEDEQDPFTEADLSTERFEDDTALRADAEANDVELEDVSITDDDAKPAPAAAAAEADDGPVAGVDDVEDEPAAAPVRSEAETVALRAQINAAYMNLETRKYVAETNAGPMRAFKQKLEGDRDIILKAQDEAGAAGDNERFMKATVLLRENERHMRSVSEKLEPVEKEIAGYDERMAGYKEQWDGLDAPAAAAPAADAVPAAETDWKKRNAWFSVQGSDAKSVYAREVGARLFKDGYTNDKPALWRELDRQMKIKFPDMRVAAKTAPPAAAAPAAKPATASSGVVAGSGARAASGRTKIPKVTYDYWVKMGWDVKELRDKYAVKG